MQLEVDHLLTLAVKEKASDVHFTAGLMPHVRREGEWYPYGKELLAPDECKQIAEHLMGTERIEQFLKVKEADFSYSIHGVGRFRVNAFFQRGSVSVAIRVLPYELPTFAELGLPDAVMRDLCETLNGIVLICGPTGSGKSTTLAAMVDHINRTSKRHIVTIEDPIEFLHHHDKSFVEQREVGMDTATFASAMKHVLRQSPDVVLVGEVRDAESVRSALMIAETGHLVLSTIHAGEASQGLSRLVDVFPSNQTRDIRVSLAVVLRGMLVQQLLPSKEGRRLVLAHELMLVNGAVRNLVREGKFEQIYTQIQTRQDEGMHTMNASLLELARDGMIGWDVALAKSPNPVEMKALMEHASSGKVQLRRNRG